MLTYRVARFYQVSPEEVEGWYNFDFLDRAEYMFIQEDLDRQYNAHIDKSTGGK